MIEPAVSVRSWSSSTRFLTVLWIILALLLTSLVALAILLLVKMDFFSTKPLTDAQLNSVWPFLGVALGAVVTLIAALLTEQHNRRADERASLEKEHQQKLEKQAEARLELAQKEQRDIAQQAETRLTIDTVAKTLELITDDSGEYAKPARVAGAIATMMELEGSAVANRILGELWRADAVDSDTAIWLIDRVFGKSDKPDEMAAAGNLLVANVSKLVPERNDKHQDHVHFPSEVGDSWPLNLPVEVRDSLLHMAVKLLQVREPEYWAKWTDYPVDVLREMLKDPLFGSIAAFTLAKLHDLGVLERLNAVPSEEELAQIVSQSETAKPSPWFASLVAEFEPWARGEDVSRAATTTTGSVVVAASESETPRATTEPR